MTTYNNQTFTSADILAESNTYNACIFNACRFNFGTGHATFNSGCLMTGCEVYSQPNNNISGTSSLNAVVFEACTIDTTFKVFNSCSFKLCTLLDGVYAYSVGYHQGGSHGTCMNGCTLVDTTLANAQPFWMYNSNGNTFSGYLRSMAITMYFGEPRKWSTLREGASLYGTGNCSGNTFRSAEGLTLLGSGWNATSVSGSTVARHANLSFVPLNSCNNRLEDSLLAFTPSFAGPQGIVGSRSIADSSNYLSPASICENSSFVDASPVYYNHGRISGTLRNTSFRGADFSNSAFTGKATSNTDVTGASGASAALDPTGLVTLGSHTRGGNNVAGVPTLAHPLTELYVTPILGPNQGFLVALSLVNGARYNFSVDNSLQGQPVSAWLLPYSSVLKAGLASGVLDASPAVLKGLRAFSARTGEQLQEVYLQVPDTTAYLFVLNASQSTHKVGISGRTGVMDASSLTADTRYDLVDMTTVAGITHTQDAYDLNYNTSVQGTPLTSLGHRYYSGFGTHANATINVPASAFSRVAGTFVGYTFDDEVRFDGTQNIGATQLVLKSGATELYRSATRRVYDGVHWVFVPHGAAPVITLKAEVPVGVNWSTHTDFLMPTFVVGKLPPAAPTDITLSDTSVKENLSIGSVVGTLGSTDPNMGDTFAYTLVSGTGSDDNASFAISNDLLATAEIYNYSVKSSYSVRIRTTDQDGLWFEKQFSISILENPGILDSDGTFYATTVIGTQTWIAENYQRTDVTNWYPGGGSGSPSIKGRLYDFATALASAPAGYHLPTDDDWSTLESYIGMSGGEIAGTGVRGTMGVKLKASSALWSSSNNGTDDYGFGAVPAGLQTGGSYYNFEDYAMFWAVMPGDTAGYRWLPGEPGNDVGINRATSTDPNFGFSVRYVKN